ncbi:MAG: glycosyltransferase family 4 protein [Gemmatimonadota bacterium]|nr:glycosyltransferase family 4 protein [Gemmatimonadota bacterium]
MNILMVNYEYPPLGGGGGVIHRFVCEEMAKRHRVVMVTSAYQDQPFRETRGGVDIIRVPVWGRSRRSVATWSSMLSFPQAVARHARFIIDEIDFDIVNGHFAVPTGPASTWLARRAGVPHVITVQGGDLYDPSKKASPHIFPPLRWSVKRVLAASARVVAASENTKANALRYFGSAVRGVDLIPLGIRPREFRRATRTELGLPEDVFLGVTVARLIRRKAHDQLIHAITRPGLEDVHIALVGSGPERDNLEQLARELGAGDRVHFPGRVDEEVKWQILDTSNAFVSATLHEGFGLMFLEAMAVGRPVVCPDFGGHTDYLTDGVTGFVTPLGDNERLAAGIGRLASEPDLVRRMGESNRKLFYSRFGAHHCAQNYEALFEEVLAEQNAAASQTAQAMS